MCNKVIVFRPKSVQLVRKPVLSVMGLLSLLGSVQINSTAFKGVSTEILLVTMIVFVIDTGTQVLRADADIGVIATLLTKPHDLAH